MATTFSARRQVQDLPVRLDRSIRNQSRQVHAALMSAIVDGLLSPGLKLPSSRALAEQLKVRRNTVVAAYEHLLSDGLVEARHGAGTYVAAELPSLPSAPPAAAPQLESVQRGAFALGNTRADALLLRRLGSSVRRCIVTATAEELGYGDPRGSARLRSQIAQNLAASRGIRCDPSCVMVVSGTQHAIRLCVDALLSRGDAIWMEDPGYYVARTTLSAAGMNLVPVPVDTEGIVVTAGLTADAAAKAAYVTPSHQFPTGVTMSMSRRVALLEWARSSQSWVFEDDYDSEFRYAGPPLTALAGIGGERVIYVGTFTKILFASLRLGYVVLPPSAIDRVITARAAFDRFPPRFMQDAVADLMADGTLSAHTRRMRTYYREARDVVAEVLTRAARGTLRVVVPTQGLHLIAYLPRRVPRRVATQIKKRAGVEAKLVSETRIVGSEEDGFVLGYSGFDIRELTATAERLGRSASEILGRGS
jgi:GntR family transcriptional regulator / MocR family aminotransferase